MAGAMQNWDPQDLIALLDAMDAKDMYDYIMWCNKHSLLVNASTAARFLKQVKKVDPNSLSD